MTKVCVIVLSYNRPRMLVEALKSIEGADEVILLDDGSDFNVLKVAADEMARFPKIDVHVCPKMTVEERMKIPRLGRSINAAIRECSSNVITYLCDDDLFHPGWIPAVKKFFDENEKDHVVRAKWGLFKDNDKPGDKLCPLGAGVDMTTGNFAHRKVCSMYHQLFWSEKTVAVHDAHFIMGAMLRKHPLATIKKLDLLAGWRREHAYNMMNFTNGEALYNKGAEKVLARPLE